jgi:hypothetical protein
MKNSILLGTLAGFLFGLGVSSSLARNTPKNLVIPPKEEKSYCDAHGSMSMTTKIQDILAKNFTLIGIFNGKISDKLLGQYTIYLQTKNEIKPDEYLDIVITETIVDLDKKQPIDLCIVTNGFTSKNMVEKAKENFEKLKEILSKEAPPTSITPNSTAPNTTPDPPKMDDE